MVITTRTTSNDFKQLIKDSDIHSKWSVSDLQRVILPLIKAQQAYFAYKDEEVQGMVTWAWLTTETVEGYVNGTQKLSPEALTGSVGDFWCIDFIAPYGNAKEVNKAFKKEFRKLRPDITSARMLRRSKGYASKITIR
mgnify:CR=1 FL=1